MFQQATDDIDVLIAAVANVESVICGTPIGVLSYDSVKNAPLGSFDVLIVDEVSKMTLPEFLAIAIKAKQWVLVGERLAHLVSLERAAVLDEPRDAEHPTVETRVIDEEVTVLGQPVPRVDHQRRHAGDIYTFAERSETR